MCAILREGKPTVYIVCCFSIAETVMFCFDLCYFVGSVRASQKMFYKQLRLTFSRKNDVSFYIDLFSIIFMNSFKREKTYRSTSKNFNKFLNVFFFLQFDSNFLTSNYFEYFTVTSTCKQNYYFIGVVKISYSHKKNELLKAFCNNTISTTANWPQI